VWQRSGRPSPSPPRAVPRGPIHPYARVLALQRSAGNRAVGILARMPLKDRTADLATYRQNWDHVEILKLLHDLDTDEERREALRTLDLTHLDALLDTVRKIQGRSKPPLPAWWTTLAKLVETARTERLETDFADALRQGQVIDTVMLLSWWEDPKALLAKARTIPAAAVANYRDVAGRVLGADHLVTRVLAFLELESLTGAAIRPTAQLAVQSAKQVGDAVAVPGGKVTTYNDVQLITGPDKRFSFDYEGDDAPNTGWIQFFAPEAEVFDAAGNSLGFETSVKSTFSGQEKPVPWGTKDDPAWSLDGEGDTAPFYEAAATKEHPGSYVGASGGHTSLPKQTAMYDRPTPDKRVVGAALKRDDAASVVVRMRFHTYLVRGMEVLYENDIVVEFAPLRRLAEVDNVDRTNTPGHGHVTSRMSRKHFEALLRKLPRWTFYPHE
jgi:hypothetical protein